MRGFRNLYRKLVYVVVGAGLVYLIYSLSDAHRGTRSDDKLQRSKHLTDILFGLSETTDGRKMSHDSSSRKTDSKVQDESEYDDVPSVPGAADIGSKRTPDESPSDEAAADLEFQQNDLAEVDLEVSPTSSSTQKQTTVNTVPPIGNSLFRRFKGPENAYQKIIVDSFLHAWNAYRKYAWGMDELRPLSKTGQQWMGVGLTIVDSLDTIIMMDLIEEYKVAREWIANHLNFEFDGEVQLFEMTIRTLGGLLSAYHLTGDELFLNKAIELGNKFTPCFNGVTKIPCSRMHMKNLQPVFIDISTAESGSIQLEFRDLSRSCNDSKFEGQISAISDHLHSLKKHDGLVSCFLDPLSGSFQSSSAVSVGAAADSYYEYLLKQWIQTGKSRYWLKNDYLEAVEGIRKHLLRHSEPSKLAFVGALSSPSSSHVRNEMEHLSCFLPGTLALGVMHGLNSDHLQLAAELTKTCHMMYESTPTKLSPEVAIMNTDPAVKEDISTQYNTRYNLQRPEAVESMFYMYRATKNQTYRDWGWKIFQAYEATTRLETGYASIDNVMSQENPGHRDKMETFYLAETLKYLYLLYSDDPQLMPLDKYVMNTEAHPLPIYSS